LPEKPVKKTALKEGQETAQLILLKVVGNPHEKIQLDLWLHIFEPIRSMLNADLTSVVAMLYGIWRKKLI
jgi:hypothetical protein